MKLLLVLPALACASLAIAQPAPMPKDFVAKANTYLDALAKAKRLSGSVLIAIDGKTVLRKAYGYADWTTRKPMTPETPVAIFSLSKSFTAGAILLLQDRGLLSVQDRASKYLTDLPQSWQEITIHQLLTHTSGIGGDDDAVKWYGKLVGRASEAIKADGETTRSKPGERYEYSNLGYVVLGQIVAKVSGEPLSRFAREEIMRPLHMSGAGFGGHWEGQSQVARGHTMVGGRLVPYDQRLSIIPGAGDVHANVDDMLKWRQAIDGGTLFSTKAREALHQPYARINEQAFYGYGWMYYTEWPLWEHTGGGASSMTSVSWLPERKMTIVVLKNTDSTAGGLPEWDLAKLAYGQELRPPRFVDLDDLARYVGVYRRPDGKQIEVQVTDDEVVVRLPGQDPQTTEYAGGSKFQGGGIVAKFVRRPDGLFDLRLLLNGKTRVIANRVVASRLEDYVGRYGDRDGEMKIERRGDWLVAPLVVKEVALDPYPILLIPSGPDRFVIPSVGAEVRFVRDSKGRVIAEKTMAGGKVVSTSKKL